MGRAGGSLRTKLYVASFRLWRRALTLAHAGFNGFWLGLLRTDDLHTIDEAFYDGDASVRAGADYDYANDQYNLKGLLPWETEALARFFPATGRLFLLGAGGGREVIALQRMGYEVEAGECHPGLVAAANDLLGRLGLLPTVRLSPRDGLPSADDARGGTRPYDGLIVGWGAYMLIRGRERRIALLRQMRALAGPGCPILLSFFRRDGSPRRLRVTALVGALVSRVRLGEPVEMGDDLVMNFVHHFDRNEIERELNAAGFDLRFFAPSDYGHAVGIARSDPGPSILPAPPLDATLIA